MRSLFGLRSDKPRSSPLEGLAILRAQQAEADLRRLGRRELWLWLSAFFVTFLSAFAFSLAFARCFATALIFTKYAPIRLAGE